MRNRRSELKGVIKVLNSMAREDDRISSDGIVAPLGNNPTRREVVYYSEEAKSLIQRWRENMDFDGEKSKVLEECEDNLERIIDNDRLE